MGEFEASPPSAGRGVRGDSAWGLAISSGVVFIMNKIPPQGIGAVCIILEGMAPIPYGNSYS